MLQESEEESTKEEQKFDAKDEVCTMEKMSFCCVLIIIVKLQTVTAAVAMKFMF